MTNKEDDRFVLVSRAPGGRIVLQGTESRIRDTVAKQCPACEANKGEEKTIYSINGRGDLGLVCRPKRRVLGFGPERICGA